MLEAPVRQHRPGPERHAQLARRRPGTRRQRGTPVLDALGARVLVVGEQPEASRLKLVANTQMTVVTVARPDSLAAEGLQPPLVQAVEERLRRAVEAGHAHDDVAAVASVV
jgi:3-hydroxyisobutyrate dehydrogenase-like beta-hydroxyacid dehydrogenase